MSAENNTRASQCPATHDTICRSDGRRCRKVEEGVTEMQLRVLGVRARRREGNPPLSADQGTRQAGGPVRRQVPDRRFRSEQPHQLGHLLDLRADPVQEPVAAAAPARRLAVRGPAQEPVHHSGAGPDALAGRDLVPGHRRRHLPEHQPDRAGRSARGGDLRRRPHLPHEHPRDDRVPRAEARRGHRGRHPRAQGTGRWSSA